MTSESCQGGGKEKGSWKFSKFAHSNERSIKIEHEIAIRLMRCSWAPGQ
jgi:hypothetical protein